MKIQFLYHPENDKYIASKIMKATGLPQSYSLEGMRVGNINALSDELFETIKNTDVLVLLIGTTFDKIAPFVWMNVVQYRTAIVGVDIHSIPDEWGETRKKGGVFSTEANFEGGKKAKLFEIYELPEGQDGILYINKNILKWCKQAIRHVESNYGIT